MSQLDPRKKSAVSFFVRHPNAANLLMVLMIIAGLFSLSKMNSQFFPNIDTDAIRVAVTWNGASAEDVEANILEIIEPQIRFIDGVDSIESIAREGYGSVVLDFKPQANMQIALSDVEAAVDGISTLPDGADTPKVSYFQFRDSVVRLILTGPFSEGALKKFAKSMRDDLLDRGIDKVEFTGVRDEEFFIGLDDYDLRRLSLTVKDIAGQISSNSQDLPSGSVNDGIEKQVRTLGSEETPEEIGKIEIVSQKDGSRVKLDEIARIERRFDPDQVRGLLDGKAAIQLTIQRAPSADSLKAAAIVEDYLAEIEPQLPKTLEVIKYDARAEYLTDRILLLVKNAGSGLLLVMIILAIFLNLRIALWVTAGIPVAILAAFVVLFAIGETINMISLFAFIMMLGIIVDDAIVVAEDTATRFSAGDPGPVAAENGGIRMLMPVAAASMTTIAAFAPIFLIGSTIGKMMGVLPVVVIAVLIASLIECFFILPGHLAHSLTPNQHRGWSVKRVSVVGLVFFLLSAGFYSISESLAGKFGGVVESAWQSMHGLLAEAIAIPVFVALSFAIAVTLELLLNRAEAKKLRERSKGGAGEPLKAGRFRKAFDSGFAALRDGPFKALVTLAYHWRYTTLTLCVASLVLMSGLLAGGRLGFVFFPSPESETVNMSVTFNVGILEEDAIAIIKKIDTAIYATEKELGQGEKLVEAAFTTLGKAGRTTADNVASIRLRLTASEVRTIRTKTIVRALNKAMPKVPGLKSVSIRGQRGGPPGADLDIKLSGAAPDVLKLAALDLRARLTAYAGVSEIDDDMPYGKPELTMTLTPRGSALGFSAQTVSDQVRDLLEGRTARKLAILDEEVDIVLQKSARENSDSLRSIWLKSPSGRYVPITEVVDLTERQGFSLIQREDGKTTIAVTADVDSNITTVQELVAKVDEELMPIIAAEYGISYVFGGRDEERKEAFADLRTGVIIALAVIYIILAWVFASYARPFAIMMVIPFGFVGAVLGHYLLGFNLTILSMIGLLGLAGILVNDSIILVSRLDERLARGEDLETASIGASCDRFRAVLLTSLTTVGGLTPLLFETSTQAQFLQPMAVTIVFGLAVATLFVLFLVPTLFGIGGDIKRIVHMMLHGRKRPFLPAR
ncbi:MAG: efflux RND transporter permease subunit [Cohaesibacter sp.]|jgi:multidrug efflux pump subunit AcrB|nr:efflux RND transporter permease subunit [Cohaesibacter sp.]